MEMAALKSMSGKSDKSIISVLKTGHEKLSHRNYPKAGQVRRSPHKTGGGRVSGLASIFRPLAKPIMIASPNATTTREGY